MSIDAIGGGGGYNPPSISEMRQRMFTKMDQDGDGVISRGECETAAQEMSQHTGLSITADQMMSIFDLDQDGVITQAEQTEASPAWEEHMKGLMETAGIRPMGPPPPPEMGGELAELVKEIITAMDTDGDGAISKTEYDAAMQQLGYGQESDATSSSASTEETGLAALLARFLELLTKMEEDSYSRYSQESQNYQGMNSYA
ncbi:MAG: hypothetical protein C4567_17505 [Deltaproteobacteria bacterium]|nr:MAG: hypothetical protein C4567_17505 [Deltaproteobacteria bacterium]